MHSSNSEVECSNKKDGEVLVSIATLVTEGRIPEKSVNSSKGFHQGPHCPTNKLSEGHTCDQSEVLCQKYVSLTAEILKLQAENIPLCLNVILYTGCGCEEHCSPDTTNALLLEQWYFHISRRKINETISFTASQLTNAVLSQLHFSQLSAWLSSKDTDFQFSAKNIKYKLSIPGETFETCKFTIPPNSHVFPSTTLNRGYFLNTTLLSLPRLTEIPSIKCKNRDKNTKHNNSTYNIENIFLDDRMHTSCMLKGKHRCEDFDDIDNGLKASGGKYSNCKRICQIANNKAECSLPTPHMSHSSPSAPGPSTSNNDQSNNYEFQIRKDEDVKNSNNENSQKLLQKNLENQETKRSEKTRNRLISIEQHTKTPKLDIELSKDEIREVMLVLNQNSTKTKNDLKQQSKSKNNILRSVMLKNYHRHKDEKSQHGNDNSTNLFCKEIHNKPQNLTFDKRNESVCAAKAICDSKCVQNNEHLDLSSCKKWEKASDCDLRLCDKLCEKSDIIHIKLKKKTKIYIDPECDNIVSREPKAISKMRDISNINFVANNQHKAKLNDEADNEKNVSKSNENGTIVIDIPSPTDQAKFRKSFDNAASMVFHSRTGLPLTSSPAPVRKGKKCFDYDSSINSVSAIKRALFSTSISTDDESESDGSIVSPCSPESFVLPSKEESSAKYHRRGQAGNLLGTFEESVLNGRLEPVSTVQGFKAELGASGSFVPRHLICPVTVFFYTLENNSSPYLGHINLGKKGYNVPKTGTVQVTLFNPLGTVVKMFVIMYDLTDMPPNSQTFIRQRTLYLPTSCNDKNIEWGPKWLRYLVHLRFMSSKSGRIYLHSDIRMIIFRKSDFDTATAHDIDMCYELRSFTHMPSNPKYSPRK